MLSKAEIGTLRAEFGWLSPQHQLWNGQNRDLRAGDVLALIDRIETLEEALLEAEAGLTFAGAGDREYAEDAFIPAPTLALRIVRKTIADLGIKPNHDSGLEHEEDD